MVYGDNFTSLATRDQCDWLANELRKHVDLKVRGILGSGPKDNKSVRILNRIVSCDGDGVTYESDQRHTGSIIKQLDMNESGVKSVFTPGIKEDPG